MFAFTFVHVPSYSSSDSVSESGMVLNQFSQLEDGPIAFRLYKKARLNICGIPHTSDTLALLPADTYNLYCHCMTAKARTCVAVAALRSHSDTHGLVTGCGRVAVAGAGKAAGGARRCRVWVPPSSASSVHPSSNTHL